MEQTKGIRGRRKTGPPAIPKIEPRTEEQKTCKHCKESNAGLCMRHMRIEILELRQQLIEEHCKQKI